jgi:hypothetical protein
LYILFYIIGFIFGLLASYLANRFATIYGTIIVDDDMESYFFKMSSKDIKNPKNKKVIFKIERKNDSQ